MDANVITIICIDLKINIVNHNIIKYYFPQNIAVPF